LWEGEKGKRGIQNVASQSPLNTPATTALMHKNTIPRLRMWKIDGVQDLRLRISASSIALSNAAALWLCICSSSDMGCVVSLVKDV